MKKSNEQWSLVEQTDRFQYLVSSRGRCKKLNLKDGTSKTSLGHLNESIGYKVFHGKYVHRLVAQAFIPNPDSLEQIDHINSVRTDNRIENLRWVTRKQNNSTLHAKQMQRQNHKSHNHKHEILLAQKDSQTKMFKSGFQAARDLGCSRPLIYNALNKRGSARKAFGWDLQWISRNDPRAQAFVQQLEQERLLKATARRKSFEEMCQHRRDKALLKRQQKLKIAQLKKQRAQEKREHKRRKRIMDQMKSLEARIEVWKRHLEVVKVENKARIQRLERKIQALEDIKQKLQAMLGDRA